MKKIISLLVFAVFCITPLFGFAAQPKPVAFLVQDYTGDVEGKDYKEWRAVTRWAYHFPYYELVEGEKLTNLRRDLDVRVIDKQLLANAVKNAQVDALVLVRVYSYSEFLDSSRCGWENGPVVRLDVDADLVCYRADLDKVLTDHVYEHEIRDLGNHTPPVEKIKWRLCDLVNIMEGRELIR